MTEHPWFSPRRYGWGAGVPRTWQGWATLAAFTAAILLATSLYPRAPVAAFAIGAVSTLLLLLAVVRRTEGGPRWHWGNPRD